MCEISFARAVCTLTASIICLLICRQNPYTTLKRDLMVPLFVRCVSGAVAFIAVAKAVQLLPLTIFQVITNMTPFISGILACIWLGEKLSFFQIVCMLLCFIGIAVVTFSNGINSEEDEYSSFKAGIALSGIISVIFALAYVTTRRVRVLHFSVIQFYFDLTSLIISGIWILFE